jgi:putative ABC transport system permease protein
MRDAADRLYKERGLYDIQIKSTTGFNEGDINALRNAAGVQTVMPTYIFDVYAYFENAAHSVRTYALPDELNQIELLEGRFPENAGEVAVERRFLRTGEYNIGDAISFGLDDMTEYYDALEYSEFTIVGVISSPLYINAHERGQTSLGNGSLDFYVYFHPSAYLFDVYTDAYIQTRESPNMDNLTEVYNDAATEWLNSIKPVGSLRVQVKEIEFSDAQTEIDDGWTEYYKNEKEFNDRIAEAYVELNNMLPMLEILDGEALETARNEYNTNIKKLEN